MNLLKGTDVTNFKPEDAPNYTDENIIQLIGTVIELDTKGLVIDPKPSNFMYDQEEGFSVLDYHLKHMGGEYGLPREIMDLRLCLTARKFESLDYEAPDYKEKSELQSLEHHKVFLPMMIRFISILQDKYPEILIAWRQQQDKHKKDPRIFVLELINRNYIPKHSDLESYLKKLEEMGF